MADTVRYGKPCMTNLPPELGRAIFKQILSTPRPDYDAMEAEVRQLEKEIMEARKHENSQRSSAK